MTEEIITYISVYQNIPKENISVNSHLVKDLGMSSMDLMDLVCAVEEHFGVEFDDDDLIDMLTVEKIAYYLQQKLN